MCDSRSKTIAWRVKRIVSGPLVLLAALLIAFEEFAWDELAAIVARLGRLPQKPPLMLEHLSNAAEFYHYFDAFLGKLD